MSQTPKPGVTRGGYWQRASGHTNCGGQDRIAAGRPGLHSPPRGCARDPEVALLIGYLDGEPVSPAFLFMVGPIAGITGVATVPGYRRRGRPRR